MAKNTRANRRIARHARVRKDVHGTPERPRLCVFRSNKNISAQIIDDVNGVTLASASSLDKELKAEIGYGGNKEAAKKFIEWYTSADMQKELNHLHLDDYEKYIDNRRVRRYGQTSGGFVRRARLHRVCLG